MSVNKKNFAAIEEALNKLYKNQEASAQRIQMLETQVAQLRAELQNQKQLTAHVLGRGMGPTAGN